MGMIVDIIGAVGNTPLIKLNSLTRDLKATVAVKMESMNPLGSVKDRIGVSMVREAEREKLIKSGHTLLVEPTSGNTGIALAFVAASRGYRLILTMPETMSEERRKLLLALGAEIVLTPGLEGMEGAIARAEQIVCDNENAYMLQQFRNKANPKVHRETTAEEIWRDSEGKVDVFVAGVGTGGTITGVGHVLKQRKPSVKIVAVEPKDSPVITQSLAGQPLQPAAHKIQGIGAGFIPGVLDLSVIDEVFLVANEESFEMGRKLPRTEGILAGISSGATVHAALELAKRPENAGKLIVAIVASTGERYLSTPLFHSPSPTETAVGASDASSNGVLL